MDKLTVAHALDDTILKPIEAVISGAYSQGRNMLYEHEVYAILSKLGLNTPKHFLVRNENLLGFRESEAFGPVISFSKGGHDAEHFARYYSPPNLILAPIDRQWAQALLESTHIQKKYAAQGKTGYISKIVEAGVKFSSLAVSFSNYFSAETQFVINEFEINPFVFTADGNFIAIDGFARSEKRREQPVDLEIASPKTIVPFFEPDGIAVVGASTTDSRKMGNLILKNLINIQRNDVYCINIKGGHLEVAGKHLPVYKSLIDIKKQVDLVIISVPVEAVLAAVKDCARKEVKAVIIIPGGSGEVSGHRNLENKILCIAKSAGFRIMGPNCLGLVYSGSNRAKGVNSFFTLEEKFAVDLKNDSNVAILSQSGALGIVEIENLKNAISPKVIVSYGNQLDVDPCDLVNFFQSDPMVDVIGCYIEGFKPNAGRKFFNIAARIVKVVHQYKKPTAVSVNVASGIDAIYNKLGKTLDTGGVRAFLSAKRAMLCLNAFIRYHLMRKSGIFSEWLK